MEYDTQLSWLNVSMAIALHFSGIKSVFQQSNTRMKLACTIGVKRIAYPIPQIAQKIDVPARKYFWAFY